MKPVQVVLRLSPDEHERAVNLREATDVPTSRLLRKLLIAECEAFESQSQKPRRRKPARSA